eukprot:TRINITY_DN3154_c0_g1_i1.p1 TRINITY_DN3154_c0_g1~~TRINITY_DN3154_c0_g1_i1.p1  ORF type:complete len:1701 (-),score=599.48 TRINITY_DN3154_c0_g1_i1:9-4373(-)
MSNNTGRKQTKRMGGKQLSKTQLNTLDSDLQDGDSSSTGANGRPKASMAQGSNIQFGFVPKSVLQSMQDDSNWRTRAGGIEELYNLVASLEDRDILTPHLSEFLQFLTANTLNDPNFKISLNTFKIIHYLVELFQSSIHPYLNDFVPHLIEKLGDNKVIIRQANMQLFYSLMDHLTPNPIMNYLLGALSHENAYVREDVINIIIMSMLTFPDNQFDYEQLVESLDAALIDDKPKVKLVAIEAFAVIYDAVGDTIYDMASFMSMDTMSVLTTRFGLPLLPTVDPETGLVEHSFIKQRSSSRSSSRSSRRTTGSRSSSRTGSRTGSRSGTGRSRDGLTVSLHASTDSTASTGSTGSTGSGKLPFQVSKPRATSARRTSNSSSYDSAYGDFQLQKPAPRSTSVSGDDLEADIEMAKQDRKLGYDFNVNYEEDTPDSVFAGSVGFFQNNANVNLNVLSPSSDSGGNTIFDWQMSPGARRSSESIFEPDDVISGAKTPEMFEQHSSESNLSSSGSRSGEYDPYSSDDIDPFRPRSELSRGSSRGTNKSNPRSSSRHGNNARGSIDSSGEFGYGSKLSRTPESSKNDLMVKSQSSGSLTSPRLSASLVKHHDQRRSTPQRRNDNSRGSYTKQHNDRRAQSATRYADQEDQKQEQKQKLRLQQRNQRNSLAEQSVPRYADIDSSDDDDDMDAIFATNSKPEKSQRANSGQQGLSQEEVFGLASKDSSNNEDRPIQGMGSGSYLDAAIDQYGEHALSPIKEVDSQPNTPNLNPRVQRLSSATRNRLAKSAEKKRAQLSYANRTTSREKDSQSSDVSSSIESLGESDSVASHDSYGSVNSRGSRKAPRVGSGGSSKSRKSVVEDTPQRQRRATLMESNAKPLGELTSDELEPLESPSKMVKAALADLGSSDAKWDSQFESLNTLRRAAAFHSDLLSNGDFHATILLLNEAVNNLRSSITKNAIMCYKDMFSNMGKTMDSQLDYVVPVLVKKTGETNVFITDAVDQALGSMVENATDSKVLASLMVVGGHKNPQVRGNAAFYMDILLAKMGTRVLSVKGFDRLLKLVASFSKEGNSVTRNIGKHLAYQIFKASGGSNSSFDKRMMRANLDEKTINQLNEAVKAAIANGGDNMTVDKLSAGQRRKYSTIGLSNRTMKSAGSTRNSPQSPMTGPIYGNSSTSSSTSTTTSTSSTSNSSSSSLSNGSGGNGRRSSNMKSREKSAGRRGKRVARSAGTSRGSVFQSAKMPVEFDNVNTIASDMEDKSWQKRMDGMEAMVSLVTKYPSESVSVLAKLSDGYIPRLSDANLKVLIQALTVLPDLLVALKDNVEVVLTNIILAMPSSLSSSKKRVQDLAMGCMKSMVDNVSSTLLAEPFSSLVTHGNSRLRPVMLDVMMDLIDPLYDERPEYIGKYILPCCFGLLSENKIDLKKRNYALIRKCHEVMGKTDFEVYVGSLSMEDEETVRRIL